VWRSAKWRRRKEEGLFKLLKQEREQGHTTIKEERKEGSKKGVNNHHFFFGRLMLRWERIVRRIEIVYKK